MHDDDLIEQQERHGRAQFIQALREENERRKGELAADTARRSLFDGPEVDWRRREPQREAVSAPTLRYSLADDEREELDELRHQTRTLWAEVNRLREHLDARIEDVIDQSSAALEEISHVFQRTKTDIDNATIARKAAVDAVNARYDALAAQFASLRALISAENAKVVDCDCSSRPLRRTN